MPAVELTASTSSASASSISQVRPLRRPLPLPDALGGRPDGGGLYPPYIGICGIGWESGREMGCEIGCEAESYHSAGPPEIYERSGPKGRLGIGGWRNEPLALGTVACSAPNSSAKISAST